MLEQSGTHLKHPFATNVENYFVLVKLSKFIKNIKPARHCEERSDVAILGMQVRFIRLGLPRYARNDIFYFSFLLSKTNTVKPKFIPNIEVN